MKYQKRIFHRKWIYDIKSDSKISAFNFDLIVLLSNECFHVPLQFFGHVSIRFKAENNKVKFIHLTIKKKFLLRYLKCLRRWIIIILVSTVYRFIPRHCLNLKKMNNFRISRSSQFFLPRASSKGLQSYGVNLAFVFTAESFWVKFVGLRPVLLIKMESRLQSIIILPPCDIT